MLLAYINIYMYNHFSTFSKILSDFTLLVHVFIKYKIYRYTRKGIQWKFRDYKNLNAVVIKWVFSWIHYISCRFLSLSLKMFPMLINGAWVITIRYVRVYPKLETISVCNCIVFQKIVLLQSTTGNEFSMFRYV